MKENKYKTYAFTVSIHFHSFSIETLDHMTYQIYRSLYWYKYRIGHFDLYQELISLSLNIFLKPNLH